MVCGLCTGPAWCCTGAHLLNRLATKPFAASCQQHDVSGRANGLVGVTAVQVWNPCFDVTPGTLIEGIITEKGVVPRDAGTGRHQVAKFIAAQQQQQVNGHAEAGKQHVFQPNRQTLGSTAVHGSNKPTGMMVQVCYVPRMLGWLDTAADRQQNGTVNGSRTAAAGATAVGQ
eukprot:GHRR01032424.1.p1 GENE.GHRR01032424.1~~GHRR01032424.1.p1  ORF type:complete len:172 (+),score=69.70 GHRR01032424.1:197-712(+)